MKKINALGTLRIWWKDEPVARNHTLELAIIGVIFSLTLFVLVPVGPNIGDRIIATTATFGGWLLVVLYAAGITVWEVYVRENKV